MSHCLCSLHLVFFLAVLCYPFPIVLAAVVPRTAAQMNQIQMSVHVCVCVCVCFNTSTFPLTQRLFFVPLPPPGGLLRKSYNSLSYYPRRKDLIYLLPLKSTSLSALFFLFFFTKRTSPFSMTSSFLFFSSKTLFFVLVKWSAGVRSQMATVLLRQTQAVRRAELSVPPPRDPADVGHWFQMKG